MKGTFRAIGPSGFGTYNVDLDSGTWTPTDAQDAPLLAPGFVDIHFHGAFGIDFMTSDAEQQFELAQQLDAIGYDKVLFTTVTALVEDVTRAIEGLPSHPVIAGFHLEGPFISPVFPGAQPAAFIQNPAEHGDKWEEILNHPQLKLVTLAPEIPGGYELIARLTERHVVSSLGHTNATFEECVMAADAGARHTTHTFNAMRPLHHREAGTVGFALLDDRIRTELIYDRIHVSPPAAGVLIRAKSDKVIAVSDSTMASGLREGTELFMWGLECVVGKGQVRLKNGTLAGSAITLADAFQNLAQDFGPELAIRSCCLNPRSVVGNPPIRQWLVFDDGFQVVDRYRLEA
jgi:N-acetylglucosamine-6-phosphate deacetylase